MSDPKNKTAKEASEIAPNEPYPTGNPPDPMEEYNKANPERSVDWATTGPDAPPPPEPEPEEDESEAVDTRSGRYGKGKK